ncbi:MAG TPA: molybdate ABC transporter substrate-binding protein [Solirubrobacteraceae bacterium]|nr:molybdate ABC transporter substrate-binding protein [Solirubrobacteraceae bacterium]
MRAIAAVCASLACAGAASGCGGGKPALEVSAAASLRKAFGQYGGQVRDAEVRYSFAGSDALAAQIEEGARPDVFASANTELPAQLYARHLVEPPVEFASNVLVLAVPAGSKIAGVEALTRPGVTIAVGSASVPIGSYTDAALSRLPTAQRRRLEANIRDREPDVTGIVGKLVTGAVDAGFVYRTDALATGGALRAIPLPPSLQPRVDYAAAVVRGSPHQASARAFIEGLLRGAGQADLRQDGFLPPSR